MTNASDNTNDNTNGNAVRHLPSVDRVLAEPALADMLASYKREIVVDAVRGQLSLARESALAGGDAPSSEAVANAVVKASGDAWAPWPTPVINATGVILHTNLGRAPMSAAAIAAADMGARPRLVWRITPVALITGVGHGAQASPLAFTTALATASDDGASPPASADSRASDS